MSQQLVPTIKTRLGVEGAIGAYPAMRAASRSLQLNRARTRPKLDPAEG